MTRIFVEGRDKEFIEVYLSHLYKNDWIGKIQVISTGGYTALYSKTAILNTEYQIGRYHAYILLLEKLDFDAFEEIHNENKEHWKMCTLAIEKLYE